MSKQNPYIWAIIFIMTACWGTWFYWTEVRPDHIRQMCSKEAQGGYVTEVKINFQGGNTDPKATYKDIFDTCQDRYGLKH